MVSLTSEKKTRAPEKKANERIRIELQGIREENKGIKIELQDILAENEIHDRDTKCEFQKKRGGNGSLVSKSIRSYCCR